MLFRTRRPASSTRRRRAAQLLEFTMVVPLVVVMMLFVVDIARVMLIRSVIDDAVYRAAHVAAVRGDAAQNLSGTPWARQAVINSLADADIPNRTRATATSNLTIRSNCSEWNWYVEIDTTYEVETFTPGLGTLMRTLAGGADAPDVWTMGSAARVQCEVIPR